VVESEDSSEEEDNLVKDSVPVHDDEANNDQSDTSWPEIECAECGHVWQPTRRGRLHVTANSEDAELSLNREDMRIDPADGELYCSHCWRSYMLRQAEIMRTREAESQALPRDARLREAARGMATGLGM
jgi:hypothetical protein